MKIQILVTYFLINFLLFLGNSYGQKNRELIILAGPSITNIQHIINGEKIFYLSPERPYYTIQFHLGANIEERIFSSKKLRLRYGLSFERRASANTSFNKHLEEAYGFLGTPISLLYQPIENRDVQFEVGAAFQYLIQSSKFSYVDAFKNYEINSIIGIQFRMRRNIMFGTRWLEPIRIMKDSGNIVNNDPNANKEIRKYKTHSFQFSLMYRLAMQ
ncbi:MAG: hypothetical protein ABIO44_08380 [Saprospiraceae bacterium]